MFSWAGLTILCGGICTLAIFSFLNKENPLYRFFEHLFIGISTGFGILYVVKNFLYPEVLIPMLGLDIYTFPDNTTSKPYNATFLWYLLPMGFGLLYYFIYSKKYNWLAKLVIGFTLGASGGLAFKGFFNQYLPQITSSFKTLVVIENQQINWWTSFSNIVFVYTLVAVLFYFLFSNKQKSTVARKFNQSGRVLLMVCFGAFFGSTVMARMALLVERLQFLIFDFIMLFINFGTGSGSI